MLSDEFLSVMLSVVMLSVVYLTGMECRYTEWRIIAIDIYTSNSCEGIGWVQM
jgi:hypothetical protein